MTPSATAPSPAAHLVLWRDVVLVSAITLGGAWLAAHFELSERIYESTRQWEHFQLDEWPVAAFVLVLCLVWLSWRRYRQTLVELGLRRAAEERLAAALAENRELTHQHLLVQESERKHLARELHDELGQYLNAIKLDAVSVRESVASDESPNGKSIELAATRTVQAVDHVHGVVERHDPSAAARGSRRARPGRGARKLRGSLAAALAGYALLAVRQRRARFAG